MLVSNAKNSKENREGAFQVAFEPERRGRAEAAEASPRALFHGELGPECTHYSHTMS